MKHISVFFILFLLVLIGCQQTIKKGEASLPEIEVDAILEEKEIRIQDIAEDISYIPLETNDSMLLRGVFLSICDDGIAIMYQVDGKIFLYDGKGKVRGIVCRKGNGPEEYVGMQQAVVDWNRNELFVLDYKSCVKVYDLDGHYKRILPIKDKVRDREMYPFGERYLAFFKEVPNTEIGKQAGDFSPYSPVLLMDKESGEITTLPYMKSSNVNIHLSTGWVNSYALYASGKQLYLSDISSDTIYHLNLQDHCPVPIITRTPSVKSMDGGDFFLNLEGATSRYYFFLRTGKEIKISQRGDASKYMQSWLYDCQTGKVCLPIFLNDDYRSMKLNAHDLIHCNNKDNHLYAKLEAPDLMEALENDELSGHLKSIAENLKEDDNPVLMVVKLKD